jgi:hypothetical protein
MPGPEFVTTKATPASLREAASTTTHPPWLWPKRPTGTGTSGRRARRQASASSACSTIAASCVLPPPGRLPDAALVEGGDRDAGAEQVAADRREVHVVVPVGGPRARVHEQRRARLALRQPQGSGERHATVLNGERSLLHVDVHDAGSVPKARLTAPAGGNYPGVGRD